MLNRDLYFNFAEAIIKEETAFESQQKASNFAELLRLFYRRIIINALLDRSFDKELFETINDMVVNSIVVNNENKKIVVHSDFPLLSMAVLSNSERYDDKYFSISVYVLHIHWFFVQNLSNDKRIGLESSLKAITSDAYVIAAVSVLAAAESGVFSLQRSRLEIDKKVERRLRESERFLNQIEKKAGEYDADLIGAKVSYQEFFDSAKLQLEAAKNSVLESGRLDGAMRTWKLKKYSHLIVAYLIYFMIILFISMSIALLFKEWSIFKGEVVDRLSVKDAYAILPVFLVPVIAVGWVLRILARIAGAAVVLADDAAQREAMLETYYRLVADTNAAMQPGDRILVLNALFRPLPGHQNEDISPPTFADVIGDLIKGKKD